jgi:hypothetical protein
MSEVVLLLIAFTVALSIFKAFHYTRKWAMATSAIYARDTPLCANTVETGRFNGKRWRLQTNGKFFLNEVFTANICHTIKNIRCRLELKGSTIHLYRQVNMHPA